MSFQSPIFSPFIFWEQLFLERVLIFNQLELNSAGGGGKTQHRKDKIREKNQKLDENRAKRIEKEKTAKAENGGSSAQEQQSSMEDAIHPSRRARVPGNRW